MPEIAYFLEEDARDLFVFAAAPPDPDEPQVEKLRDVWGDDPDRYFFNGREVTIGDRFERHKEITDENGVVIRPAGPWRLLRSQGEPERGQRVRRVNMERSFTRDAGQPMIDPDGLAIWTTKPDGTRERPVQPAPGEQARDPWTGALLYTEEGQPILVPSA